LENKNYPQDLKIKLGPIHKLKGTINSDWSDHGHKTRAWKTYIKFLIPLTPSMEEIMNLHHGFKYIYKQEI
jgi:hypothetical protein